MISKMRKFTFLIYHKEYERFLSGIRNLGVVHVVEKQAGEPDEELQQLLQRSARLKGLQSEMALQTANPNPESFVATISEEELCDGYAQLQAGAQELNQQLPALEKDIAQLSVWGDFQWESVEQLQRAGWDFRFFSCPEKDYQEEWGQQWGAVKVAEQNHLVYFVTISNEPVELGLEPMKLPAESLSELLQKKEHLLAQMEEQKNLIKEYCEKYATTAAAYARREQGLIDLKKVKLSSERKADGAVMLLDGWVPEEGVQKLVQWLEEEHFYFESRVAHKEDNAPIKLKNNAFTRMYEVLTKMYGMPDYGEFDPTPIVAPFFTLFFAFCMGDAGYGLVLIALGFFLKAKLGKSMAGMMNLVITLGIATFILGTILGTCFGVDLFHLDLPDWLKQFMIVGKIGDTAYDKQMLLALIIGVVHICLAMTVKAIVSTVRYGFKESLSAWGWLLLVVGFIATGGLSFFEIISEEVSTWAFIIIGGVSAIGIYLLNNFRRNIFVNIGAGLWDTYNMATGLMGDVLSYIRLYALGLAGAMLGGVFNQLAFMVQEGAGGIPGWIFCGLILIVGHALNIAMSCLSAFVHPLRLNFVEYFKNAGYDGKGEAYKPFSMIQK
jgi:V/A-type H+-transporting ATPase subunit I